MNSKHSSKTTSPTATPKPHQPATREARRAILVRVAREAANASKTNTPHPAWNRTLGIHIDPRPQFILEGDSMGPRFVDGTRAFCSLTAKPRNGDIVVALLRSGGVLCKRFRRLAGKSGVIRLESLNQDYAPVDVQKSEIKTILAVDEFQVGRSALDREAQRYAANLGLA